MNILQACDDPKLFGPFFKKPSSWIAWRAFLAALFALPMTAQELAIYRKHTGRDTPPTAPSTDAFLVVGRRGGKSFTMALVAVFLACFKDCRPYLQPGEHATVAVIAADRKQARVVMRYIRGMLNGISMLRRMIEREAAEGFDLNNSVTIEVTSASFRATRGYTFAAVIADEISYWRTEEDSANVDTEILNAVRPGLSTIPGAMLICASSPHAQRGELFENFRRYYGRSNGPLVWRATTREMNPTIRQSIIDEALERDHARASAEYMAVFRQDISSLLTKEVIDSVTIPGRYELPRMSDTSYLAFVDPSGGSADSMTLAIAHRDKNGHGVLDVLRERRPPFSPEDVVEEFSTLLKDYRINRVTGDRYAGEWVRQPFRQRGIDYVCAEQSASDFYRDVLCLFNSGKIEILDLPRLTAQFVGLERRVSRSGKDLISHPPNGHDDCANSCAAALVLTTAKSPLIIPPAAFARMAARRPRPQPCFF